MDKCLANQQNSSGIQGRNAPVGFRGAIPVMHPFLGGRPHHLPGMPLGLNPANSRKDMRSISVMALESIENAPDASRLVPVFPPPLPGMVYPPTHLRPTRLGVDTARVLPVPMHPMVFSPTSGSQSTPIVSFKSSPSLAPPQPKKSDLDESSIERTLELLKTQVSQIKQAELAAAKASPESAELNQDKLFSETMTADPADDKPDVAMSNCLEDDADSFFIPTRRDNDVKSCSSLKVLNGDSIKGTSASNCSASDTASENGDTISITDDTDKTNVPFSSSQPTSHLEATHASSDAACAADSADTLTENAQESDSSTPELDIDAVHDLYANGPLNEYPGTQICEAESASEAHSDQSLHEPHIVTGIAQDAIVVEPSKEESSHNVTELFVGSQVQESVLQASSESENDGIKDTALVDAAVVESTNSQLTDLPSESAELDAALGTTVKINADSQSSSLGTALSAAGPDIAGTTDDAEKANDVIEDLAQESSEALSDSVSVHDDVEHYIESAMACDSSPTVQVDETQNTESVISHTMSESIKQETASSASDESVEKRYSNLDDRDTTTLAPEPLSVVDVSAGSDEIASDAVVCASALASDAESFSASKELEASLERDSLHEAVESEIRVSNASTAIQEGVVQLSDLKTDACAASSPAATELAGEADNALLEAPVLKTSLSSLDLPSAKGTVELPPTVPVLSHRSPGDYSDAGSEPITSLSLSTCSKPQVASSGVSLTLPSAGASLADSSNSSACSPSGKDDHVSIDAELAACRMTLEAGLHSGNLDAETWLPLIQRIITQARFVANTSERQTLVQRAMEALKLLAARNVIDAVYLAANLCVVGVPGFEDRFSEPDWEQAFKGYFHASKLGHVEAYFHLACCYLHGKGTKRSVQRANEFFRRAAIMKQPGAMYRVAAMYLDGELNTSNDPKTGIKWLKMAAKYANKKYPQAVYRLAMYHENGFLHHIFQDHAYAVQLLQMAATNLNCADSQCTLGECYQSGRLSVYPDAELARYWYLQAANQGHAEANFRLGSWYLAKADWPECGNALPEGHKSYMSALHALRYIYHAATLSHLHAMYVLANLVETCKHPGLLADVGSAFDPQILNVLDSSKPMSLSQQWCLRAAAGGHLAAQQSIEAALQMDANAVKKWHKKYERTAKLVAEADTATGDSSAFSSAEQASADGKSGGATFRSKFRGLSVSLPRKFGSQSASGSSVAGSSGSSTLLRTRKPRRLSITSRQTSIVAASPTAASPPSGAPNFGSLGRAVSIKRGSLSKHESWTELSVSPKWSVTEIKRYGGLIETKKSKDAQREQISMPLTSRNFSFAPHDSAKVAEAKPRPLVRAPTVFHGHASSRRSSKPQLGPLPSRVHPIQLNRRMSSSQPFDVPTVSYRSSGDRLPSPAKDGEVSSGTSDSGSSVSGPVSAGHCSFSGSSNASSDFMPPSPITSISESSISVLSDTLKSEEPPRLSPEKQAPFDKDVGVYLKIKSFPRLFSFSKQKV